MTESETDVLAEISSAAEQVGFIAHNADTWPMGTFTTMLDCACDRLDAAVAHWDLLMKAEVPC